MTDHIVEEVAAELAGRVESGVTPGIAVAAARHGEVFFRQAWGCRNDGSELDTSVTFPFMSFTKGITATVVCAAQAGGGFEWDDLVADHIDGYGCKGKERTTIRHLLTHAAGIPNAGEDAVLTDVDDWTSAIAVLCAAETEWEPGTRTAYHGLPGLLLAAEITRRVAGESFAALCQRLVLGPVGAAASFEVPDGMQWPDPNDEDFKRLVRWHPAGGLFGTLDDALRILQLHLQGGRWGDAQVLPPAAWSEMHRVQYAAEMEAAEKRGEAATHEHWALGWMLKGDLDLTAPNSIMAHWFGLAAAPSAAAFSHAGTSTVLGAADPTTDVAVAVMTTSNVEVGPAVAIRAAAARLLGAVND